MSQPDPNVYHKIPTYSDKRPKQEIPVDHRTNAAFFKTRPPATDLQALMETAAHDTPQESAESLQRLREAVGDCLVAISHEEVYTINAKDVEGLSYSQLGARMGYSKSHAERQHKKALAALSPLLQAHPIIQERIPALKATTWNQGALDALQYMRVIANTTLPISFEEGVLRGKTLISAGWQETGGQLTRLLVAIGASAFNSIGVNDENLATIHTLLCDRHHKYGVGNINEFKEYGLLVRISDKVARIKNGVEDFEDETYLDAYYDIVGYAAIAHMLDVDAFKLPLETN